MADEEKAPQQEIKVEITQDIHGQVTLETFSDSPVAIGALIGLIEIAKTDIILNTGKTVNEELIEIEIDELDLKLNPNQTIALKTKMKIPKSAFDVRARIRNQALEETQKN